MATFTILFTVLALPVALFVWSASSLAANKAKAQSAGFPILVRWTTPINPLWLMTGSTIVKTCRALGIGTENFHRYYKFGWEANQRHLVHQVIGPVFMLVTPGGNWLCVADAEVIQDVLHRRNEFTRNIEQMSVLNVYGSNISSTDGEDWQRHRKITAITFTENNNQLVWRQSLLQAKDMLKYWFEKQPIKTVNDDTKVFTLNVLAAALFNKVYPFEGATESKSSQLEDNSYLYRDSLGRILANIIPIFVFGGEGLKAWWMPKSWKKASEAVAVFRSYVSSLIEEERVRLSQGTRNNQTLVASLVRACEQEKDEEERAQRIVSGGSGRKTTLTEQEIISNLFVYAFAGNDTTAISLAHLLYDLAAHPESQDWIAEEIRHYLPDDDISQWDYSQCAKLKRCLAVVMESLRFNHPLGQLVKTTAERSVPLRFGSTTHIVPPGTAVHLSMAALHTHPKYWGTESMIWNPNKFISQQEGLENSIKNEVLASDQQAHFLPWAYGRRVCPGKKFSQVELCAALAVIFRDHRIQPRPRAGETLDQARARVFHSSLDIEHEGTILHEMREPQSVALEFLKREQ